MIEINTATYAEGDLEDIDRIRNAAQHAENLGLDCRSWSWTHPPQSGIIGT